MSALSDLYNEIGNCRDCELAKYPNSVHAQYHELATLPADIKAKMWLYHNDGDRPNAVEDGFAGFVNKGDIFDFSLDNVLVET